MKSLSGIGAVFGSDEDIIVNGVIVHKTFGTVGDTLIAVSQDDEIQYMTNRDHQVRADTWQSLQIDQ